MREAKQLGFVFLFVAAVLLVRSARGVDFVIVGGNDLSRIGRIVNWESDSFVEFRPYGEEQVFFAGRGENCERSSGVEILCAAPCRWEGVVEASVNSRLELWDFAAVGCNVDESISRQIFSCELPGAGVQCKPGILSKFIEGKEVSLGGRLLGWKQLARKYSDTIDVRFGSAACCAWNVGF